LIAWHIIQHFSRGAACASLFRGRVLFGLTHPRMVFVGADQRFAIRKYGPWIRALGLRAKRHRRLRQNSCSAASIIKVCGNRPCCRFLGGRDAAHLAFFSRDSRVGRAVLYRSAFETSKAHIARAEWRSFRACCRTAAHGSRELNPERDSSFLFARFLRSKRSNAMFSNPRGAGRREMFGPRNGRIFCLANCGNLRYSAA